MNQSILQSVFQKSQEYDKHRQELKSTIQSNNLHSRKQIIFPKNIYSPSDITIAAQKWLMNGFLIQYNNLFLCVDPAADFLSKCSQSGIDLTLVNTVYLSHAHIDHYASINIIMEQIALSKNIHNTKLLLPKTAVKNKVISDYHLGQTSNESPQTTILQQNQHIALNTGTLLPVKAHHSIKDTFGFVLQLPSLTIGYTSDTGYAKTISVDNQKINVSALKNPIYQATKLISKHVSIRNAYKDCDILIVNLNSFEYNRHSKTHLTAFDLIDIVKDSKIKQIILNHLNTHPLLDNDLNNDIAKYIEEKTGIKTYLVNNEGMSLPV